VGGEEQDDADHCSCRRVEQKEDPDDVYAMEVVEVEPEVERTSGENEEPTANTSRDHERLHACVYGSDRKTDLVRRGLVRALGKDGRHVEVFVSGNDVTGVSQFNVGPRCP
jgi:hypothetical protein